jgi:hypothetical protein
MTEGEETRYKLTEEALDRTIGDDLLVHRFDNDEVYVFNAHARLVFEAVKAGGTRTEIQRYVAEKGFAGEAALQRVDRALDEMVQQGLAIPEGAPPPGP